MSAKHLQQQLFESKRRLAKAEQRFWLDVTRRRLHEVIDRKEASK